MPLKYCKHEEVHTIEGDWLVTTCKKCPARAEHYANVPGSWPALPRYIVEM